MPSLGPAEILVILVVALLVFGPDKMPEIGRQLVRGVREFRRVQQHLGSELRGVVSEFDVDVDGADADDANDTTASRPRPGGDPVPTLPAREVDAGPASPDASPPSAASPATAPNTPKPPNAAPPPSPGIEANGGSPPAQPSDSS